MGKVYTVLRKQFVVDEKMELYIQLHKQYLDKMKKANELKRLLITNVDSIEQLLEVLNKCLEELVVGMVNTSVDILLDNGVYTIDAEVYLEKYYYDYFDCSEIITPVVEKYIAITQTEEELARYREYIKSSRKKWRGGGFGIKGAIKGAVTAEIMNVGTNFIHALGDHTKKVNDEYAIKKMKNELQSDSETQKIIGEAITSIFDGWFDSIVCELAEHGIINKPNFDITSAKAIMNNINKRADVLPEDKRRELLGEVFTKAPFFYPLYEKILSTTLVDEDDNLEFAEYIGYKEKYDTDKKAKEELIKLILQSHYAQEIDELKEKGKFVMSNNELKNILDRYIELQKKSGLDLNKDIEFALYNRFEWNIQEEEYAELEDLFDDFSGILKNVNFNSCIEILNNRRQKKNIVKNIDLEQMNNDAKNYSKAIGYEANFMKIYEKALEGYGPAQQVICNHLLLIADDFYNKLDLYCEQHEDLDIYGDVLNMMTDIVSVLIPVDLEYAKVSDEKLENDYDCDVEDEIAKHTYDLSNDFHKFMNIYIRLVTSVVDEDEGVDYFESMILLANNSCVAANYFLGMHIVNRNDINEISSEYIKKGLDCLENAAKNGYLAAAKCLVRYYEKLNDMVNAKKMFEKYITASETNNHISILINSLGNLNGFGTLLFKDWLTYYRTLKVTFFEYKVSTIFDERAVFSLFTNIDWINKERSIDWKTLRKSKKVQMCLSEGESNRIIYNIEQKYMDYCSYHEVPIMLVKNNEFLMLTNYSVYYSDKNKIVQLNLKSIDDEKIEKIKEILCEDLGDDGSTEVTNMLINCLYWIKNIYDDSCFYRAEKRNNIQYACQLRQNMVEQMCFDVLEELEIKYGTLVVENEYTEYIRYKKYVSVLNIIVNTLDCYHSEIDGDGVYRGPEFGSNLSVKEEITKEYGLNNETIYVMCNFSSTFSPFKSGLVFTDKGLHCKKKEERAFVDWNDLTRDDYQRKVFGAIFAGISYKALAERNMDVIFKILGSLNDQKFFEIAYRREING